MTMRRSMMCATNSNKRGASLIEYAVLTAIVLSALYMMRDTISQGIFSKYKQTGESIGFGRQFDAKRTIICRQDVISYNANGTPNMGVLYDESCFHARVNRKPILNANGSAWDAVSGGCPACDPGTSSESAACFACEDAIKNQCAVASSFCAR